MAGQREPGELDATARYAIKLTPEDVQRWVVPDLSTDLMFNVWLDTEMIAFPGEPRRRCDTVGELLSHIDSQAPWALVLEVEARPRSAMRGRLPEYMLRVFRRLRHGPHRRDPYMVAGGLIVLSGEQGKIEVHMQLPGTTLVMGWTVAVMNVAKQNAMLTLQRIRDRKLGLGILVWVPLMDGADDPAVVDEWMSLILLEFDEQKRRDYMGLARVFAEWAGRMPVWQRAVEGWDVDTWKSQTIETWRTQGRVQEKRESLVRLMQLKYKGEVPADLVQAIEQTKDLKTLAQWFDQVALTSSLDDFRKAILPSPGGTGNGSNGS